MEAHGVQDYSSGVCPSVQLERPRETTRVCEHNTKAGRLNKSKCLVYVWRQIEDCDGHDIGGDGGGGAGDGGDDQPDPIL